jgi:HD superfamily phosphohydrolase
MDYLVRDALFTGAAYGRVDVTWLLSNLGAWVADGQVHLLAPDIDLPPGAPVA